MSAETCLIVSKESAVRDVVDRALGIDGRRVIHAENLHAAVAMVRRTVPNLMLVDVDGLGGDGFELLSGLPGWKRDLDVIVITARYDVEAFARAQGSGVFDVLVQPLDLNRVREVSEKALAAQRSRRLGTVPMPGKDDRERLIGKSEQIVEVNRRIAECAPRDVTVLISGETGTGKELVARLIHEHSARRGPFTARNVGGVVQTLVEPELFGHVKGAFTGANSNRKGLFELASRGTIFLDEIGEASADLQVKLLRVLQERTFLPVGGEAERTTDARVIAATNRDLGGMVRTGEFRGDLYFRLAVVEICLPPLRERLDDLEALVPHLLARSARELGFPEPPLISDDVWDGMHRHPWFGNVRELENCLMRGLLRAKGRVMRWEDVGIDSSPYTIPREVAPELTRRNEEKARSRLTDSVLRWETLEGGFMTVQAAEREHVKAALRRTLGNVSLAAQLLGIPRSTLRSRMTRLDIQRSGWKENE